MSTIGKLNAQFGWRRWVDFRPLPVGRFRQNLPFANGRFWVAHSAWALRVISASVVSPCTPPNYKALTVNWLTGNFSFMSIQSFTCSDTESLFTTGKCRRFFNIKSVAERKLAQLDAALSVSFMKAPTGNDLKEYDGAWHVRINDQWRLSFKWGESGPCDVLIEDPH